jgi:hypothetical protein
VAFVGGDRTVQSGSLAVSEVLGPAALDRADAESPVRQGICSVGPLWPRLKYLTVSPSMVW